jgi:hypothetical protein
VCDPQTPPLPVLTGISLLYQPLVLMWPPITISLFMCVDSQVRTNGMFIFGPL